MIRKKQIKTSPEFFAGLITGSALSFLGSMLAGFYFKVTQNKPTDVILFFLIMISFFGLLYISLIFAVRAIKKSK